MTRRFLPFAVLTVVGVSSLGVAYAGSRVVRSQAFQHFHGARADREAEARAMVADMLDEIDASDDQIAAIEAILDGTHIQLEALHDGFDDHHDQVKAVLVAETVDREALEELRLEAVGVFDQASQLIAGAVGDVGEVLNPEQRAELAELAEELHGE